jgi:hypothetical protein
MKIWNGVGKVGTGWEVSTLNSYLIEAAGNGLALVFSGSPTGNSLAIFFRFGEPESLSREQFRLIAFFSLLTKRKKIIQTDFFFW